MVHNIMSRYLVIHFSIPKIIKMSYLLNIRLNKKGIEIDHLESSLKDININRLEAVNRFPEHRYSILARKVRNSFHISGRKSNNGFRLSTFQSDMWVHIP